MELKTLIQVTAVTFMAVAICLAAPVEAQDKPHIILLEPDIRANLYP